MRVRKSVLLAGLSVFLQVLTGLGAGAEGLSSYAGASTIEVVTTDPDGQVRNTTVWVVVVDGAAYINTNGTTWGENVERTPRVMIRLADSSRSFDIRFVTDDPSRKKIHHAFREKYGFQDKLVGLFFDPAESVIMQLVDSKDAE